MAERKRSIDSKLRGQKAITQSLTEAIQETVRLWRNLDAEAHQPIRQIPL